MSQTAMGALQAQQFSNVNSYPYNSWIGNSYKVNSMKDKKLKDYTDEEIKDIPNGSKFICKVKTPLLWNPLVINDNDYYCEGDICTLEEGNAFPLKMKNGGGFSGFVTVKELRNNFDLYSIPEDNSTADGAEGIKIKDESGKQYGLGLKLKLDEIKYTPPNYELIEKYVAADIARTEEFRQRVLGKFETNNKKENPMQMLKSYLREHKDVFFTLGVALVLDHFVLGGKLREKIQEVVELALDRITAVLKTKEIKKSK